MSPLRILSLRLIPITLLTVGLLGSIGCGQEAPAPKVLVIGMDGATWDLMDPWMEEGHLPRLNELRDAGVSGRLLSSVPPMSPPAWTTAATGVNPGKHGIYDFLRFDPDDMISYTETARSRRVPAVWSLLSEKGRRVGVLNLPMSDPPDGINGFHVAGMPHPDSVGYAHPPELEDRLRQDGYMLDVMGERLQDGQEESVRDRIQETFRRRRDLAMDLARENPDLDLFWVVFTATDRISHFFWKFMETDHPSHDPARSEQLGSAILDIYRGVDAAVGDLVDLSREQAQAEGRELSVIVLSDHGFYGVHRVFRPRSFFKNPTDGKEAIHDLYSLEFNGSMIHVPVRGRERTATRTPAEQDRLVDEVIERVLAARDPEGGASPVVMGARKEDLFRGPYTDKAPDILFLPRRPYFLINEEGDKDPFASPVLSFSGHHDMRGILIAAGPMFGSGKLEGHQSLVDIAPTLLYLSGETVPGYMEGNVLNEIFTSEYLDRQPVRRDQSDARLTGTDDAERIQAIPYLQ